MTENVFRQRINQLFQSFGDIWRAIAKQFQWAIAQHSLWEIAFRVPRVSSQGKILNVLRGDREALPAGDHLPASSQGKTVNLLLVRGDGISGRLRSTPRGRSHYTPDGRLRSTPFGRSLSSRDVSCSVPVW
ncbi:hypothetical protein [Cylindrospermopsis sp. CR12]|uniref:hypothetical protein n=1 Tax=Cylindrospermopsis sp. CR12 TaxID=1747196 RepID=UPI0019107967|nr:hypothetical protein [Cylindrospermopsis sp. CR12]